MPDAMAPPGHPAWSNDGLTQYFKSAPAVTWGTTRGRMTLVKSLSIPANGPGPGLLRSIERTHDRTTQRNLNRPVFAGHVHV
jgi:hypothetical protein